MKNKLMVLTLALGVMSQEIFAKKDAALHAAIDQIENARTANDASFEKAVKIAQNRVKATEKKENRSFNKSMKIAQARVNAQDLALTPRIVAVSQAAQEFSYKNAVAAFENEGGLVRRVITPVQTALMTPRDAAIARISASNASGKTLAPRILSRTPSVIYVAPATISSGMEQLAAYMTPKTAAVVAGTTLATAGGVYAYKYFNQPKPLTKYEKASQAVKNAYNNSKSFVTTHKVATGSGIAVVAAGLGYLAYKKGFFKNPFGKATKITSKPTAKAKARA